MSSTKSIINEEFQLQEERRINLEQNEASGKQTKKQLNEIFTESEKNQSIMTDDEDSIHVSLTNIEKGSESLFSSSSEISPNVAKLSQQLRSLKFAENSESIELKVVQTQASTVSNRSELDLSDILNENTVDDSKSLKSPVSAHLRLSPINLEIALEQSQAATTIGNSNSYRMSELLDNKESIVISLLDSSEEFEKAQGGETPEKSLDSTIPNTPEPESDSTNTSKQSEEQPEVVIIPTSDEEEEEDKTPTDSIYSAVVSALRQSSSSEVNRFYTQIPPVTSQDAQLYQPSTWMRKNVQQPTISEEKEDEDAQPSASKSRLTPQLSSPKTSSMDTQSNTYNVSINISLKINATIHEVDTSSESVENGSSGSEPKGRRVKTSNKETTDDRTTSTKKDKKKSPDSPKKAFISPKPGTSKTVTANPKELKNVQNEVAIQNGSENEERDDLINEKEVEAINVIYGSDRQTPVLIKKLSTAAKQSLQNLSSNSTPQSFSDSISFNVRDGLSSTHINQPRQSRIAQRRQLQICDSDTESESSVDSSEDSWKRSSSESESELSSSPERVKPSRKPHRKTAKTPIRPRLPSYSDSSCGSDEDRWTDPVKSPAGNVKSPTLNTFLDGCEFKPKKIAATPGTSTKRKLYNPNAEPEENEPVVSDLEDDGKESKPRNLDNDISRIHDDTLTFTVPEFLLPKPVVNKKLLKIKDTEMTPKLPKPKENVPRKTPKSAPPKAVTSPSSSTDKKKERKTLGFLQSLDGKFRYLGFG